MGKKKKKLSEKRRLEAEKERGRAERASETLFDAEKMETKTLAEILDASKKPVEIFIPELGCKIRYGRVAMKKFSKFTEIKDRSELAIQMLYEMLHAADPTVTKTQIEELGFDIVASMIGRIVGESGFLTTQAGKLPKPGEASQSG